MAEITCPITINTASITATVSTEAAPAVTVTVDETPVEVTIAVGQVGAKGDTGDPSVYKSFSVAMAIGLG